jgi:glycosyltransferase involved in cell wall biosynthesis
MNLSAITPMILTYNEAPNIERTLSRLVWAKQVVIVDSFSSDATPVLARKFSNVRFFQRKFDTHASQWNFALREALDADYVLTDDFLQELRWMDPRSNVNGFRASFRYCIGGKPLRASLYPPVTVLYRRGFACYEQLGHTQKIVVHGRIQDMKSPIWHDDRKSFSHWLNAQKKYMQLEVKRLKSGNSHLRWTDQLRQLRVIAPLGVFFYCLLGKGLILNGVPGFVYAGQRTIAEALLSFYLIKSDLGGKP